MVDHRHDILAEPERSTMHVLIRRLLLTWEVWALLFFVTVLFVAMNALIFRSSQWSRIEQKIDRLHGTVQSLAGKQVVDRKDIRQLEADAR